MLTVEAGNGAERARPSLPPFVNRPHASKIHCELILGPVKGYFSARGIFLNLGPVISGESDLGNEIDHISQNVMIKWFLRSQFTHKTINLIVLNYILFYSLLYN